MVKRISKYTIITLTSLVFLLSLYIMIFGAIARKNNTLLSIFGYSYSAVPTSSMEGDNPDSFDAGSFIITKKVKYESINIGDIIVFKQDNILVVHRVVDITEEGSFITKGDNNSSIDNYPVTKDTYQAKMIKSFTFLGLGTKLGSLQVQILVFLIFVLIIFIIYQVFNLFKTIHEERLRKIKEEYSKESALYEK